jgi:hypothetical protein
MQGMRSAGISDFQLYLRWNMRMRMFGAASALAAGLAFSTATSRAAILTMDSTDAWNGTSPTGPTPWLEATFTDAGTNTVTMKLTAENLSTNSGNAEDVMDWLFNLDPALTPSNLMFNFVSQTGSFTDPTINATTHGGQTTQGNVPFDIDVAFATGNPSNRFSQGDSITYTITDTHAGDTLDAESFDFTTSKSPFGPFYDSAHIQNTGSNGNGSGDIAATTVTVPEPYSISMMGLTGMALLRRRRKVK